jgi:TolB-like protein/Flp pilus assembly protein TadD
MSADAENEYFVDGITEELISQLSKISGLRVIARTSVMAYKGTNKKIDEIGRQLRVGTILEGSARKAENQIRITAQLIDVQSQEHLWSQDYNRELKGIFAIQSDIAQRVAEALKVQLLAGEKQQIGKEGTSDLEAYSLYLKGHYSFDKQTKEGLLKAIDYFEQAIEKDPNYALAYAWMSLSYSTLGWWAYLPPKEVFPKAKVAAEKALELDNALAEGYSASGTIKMVYDYDWSGAERDLKRSLELNSSSGWAHNVYGSYLMYTGRFDEAIVERKRAVELDPLTLTRHKNLALTFIYARRYDQAIDHCRRILEWEPNYWDAHRWLGRAYLEKGMYEEAIAEYKKAVELSGRTPWAVASLGLGYAQSGRRDEAQKVYNELKERAKQEHIPLAAFSDIHAAFGEKDQAIDYLQKVYEDRTDDSMLYLKIAQTYDNLRSDPRFIELMRKVGLQ